MKIINKEAELFLKLKYNIITQDMSTWHYCNSYPLIVIYNWIAKCIFLDQYLFDDYQDHNLVSYNIDLIKQYIDGDIDYTIVNANWKYPSSNFSHKYNRIYYVLQPEMAPSGIMSATELDWNGIIEILIEELYNYENKGNKWQTE